MRPRSRLVGVGVIAALFSVSTATRAFEICTAEADGTFTPQFGIEPSMVVHDAVLDKTLGELGVSCDPNELAFSFRRTIEALLKSAGSPSDPAAQQAFVQGLLDTIVLSPSFKLNAAAGIQMPVDGRTEQSKLSAAAMLDPASDEAMKPLALFNRFDLAPDNWSHCGEHRIVYGKKKSADGARFLMIFEAMVPNPRTGADGCKPIAEFWANLSDGALTDIERGQRLSAFYYEGKTSPTLASPDLKTPVVDYRNYGSDGGRGQVRANMFMDQPWQLREWLTQRTFDPTPGSQKLAFVPTTVKDNPLAELYHDSLAGTDLAANNVAATLDLVHGQFVQALTSTIGPRLLSETTAKHQDLVNALSQFHLIELQRPGAFVETRRPH